MTDESFYELFGLETVKDEAFKGFEWGFRSRTIQSLKLLRLIRGMTQEIHEQLKRIKA